MNQTISNKRRLKIARDYHFTPLSNKDIGLKHGISAGSVKYCADTVPPEAAFIEEKKQLIKIKPEDFERALIILKEYGIMTYEIAPRFELQEFYNSSING